MLEGLRSAQAHQCSEEVFPIQERCAGSTIAGAGATQAPAFGGVMLETREPEEVRRGARLIAPQNIKWSCSVNRINIKR